MLLTVFFISLSLISINQMVLLSHLFYVKSNQRQYLLGLLMSYTMFHLCQTRQVQSPQITNTYNEASHLTTVQNFFIVMHRLNRRFAIGNPYMRVVKGVPNPISQKIVSFKSPLKFHNLSLCCSN